MNISTYEARIAALEAQQGPGPVQKTGLVSMMFTPDIRLSDGTTINKKLGDLLPMTTGNEPLTVKTTADQIPVTTTFNVEVVPGSEWYALKDVDGQGLPIFGGKGEKTYRSVTSHNEASRELILDIVGAAAATTVESDPSFHPASIRIQITAPLL